MSDERLQEAVVLLLENYWIVKQDQPDAHYLVKHKEPILKPFFHEIFHYNLVVNKYFARLEKIPVVAEGWMGIEDFKEPQDYAILCCLLAYLEKKDIDEQFLFSNILDEIKLMYPGDLSWENSHSKVSVCRVLRFAVDKIGMIKCIAGDIGQSQQLSELKVLYQNTILSRYYLRYIERNLTELTKEDMLALQHEQTGLINLTRAQKSYRRLVLTPVVHREEVSDEEFDYLGRYRESISTAIEKHTYFNYEISGSEAFLTTNENRRILTLSVNDRKVINNIALHFAAMIKRLYDEQVIDLTNGLIEITIVEYNRLVKQLREEYSMGWNKVYREETSVDSLAYQLLDYLQEWKMATYTKDVGIVKLYPILVRTIGQYPEEFNSAELALKLASH